MGYSSWCCKELDMTEQQAWHGKIINEASKILKTGQGKILKAPSSVLGCSISHNKFGLCTQVWRFSDTVSPKRKPQSPAKAKVLGKVGVLVDRLLRYL